MDPYHDVESAIRRTGVDLQAALDLLARQRLWKQGGSRRTFERHLEEARRRAHEQLDCHVDQTLQAVQEGRYGAERLTLAPRRDA